MQDNNYDHIVHLEVLVTGVDEPVAVYCDNVLCGTMAVNLQFPYRMPTSGPYEFTPAPGVALNLQQMCAVLKALEVFNLRWDMKLSNAPFITGQRRCLQSGRN